VGVFLLEPPPVAPGGQAHVPEGSLDTGVAAWRAGDTARAVLELDAWLASGASPWGRRRTAGRFLLGWIHLQEGRDNLASAQFTRVRLHKQSPLRPWGAFYEALADQRRGRHAIAARECSAYRAEWPEGPHAEDCLLLMGAAYADAGLRASSIQAYTDWLEANPDDPRQEEARLGIALAWRTSNPKEAARQLQALLLDHDWATTGLAAQAALAALEDQGVLPPPIDAVEAELRRAVTLKNCGDREEAWAAYCHLRDDHADEARVAGWVGANRDSFAHRTRHFESLASAHEAAYRRSPNASSAWKAFRYHFRAGQFQEAGEWGDLGVERHSSSSRFRYNRDQVAQAWQLAGDYDKALEHWDAAARSGGASGRLARFYAAFAAYRDRDWDNALARLDAIVEAAGTYLVPALYYRGRTQARRRDWRGSRQDLDQTVERDDRGWYASLVGALRRAWSKERPPAEQVRVGRYPGVLLQGPPRPPTPSTVGVLQPASLASAMIAVPRREIAWDALAWPLPSSAPVPALPQAPGATLPRALVVPDDAAVGRFHDPRAARAAFVDLVEVGEELWPELPAMLDLADVGISDLTAPFMAGVYEEWDKARRRRIWGQRGEDLREVDLDSAAWREVFLHARDPHGLARKSPGLERAATTDQERLQAVRLAWPTAYRSHVLAWSRAYDVDPLLVWGLMRQESLYRSHALSRVGAVGVMQVMPATGARIARDLGDLGYTPGRLQDPATNVRYGTWYLSQLLDRFDGVWPIAVAAYNAGPVNASAWVQAQHGDLPLDAWVEQIPLSETRNYVKRVGGNYAKYLSIYAEPGVVLEIPEHPLGDDREVIDY